MPRPIVIRKSDLEFLYFSGKKGGQNVNRHKNCVEIRHVPSGAHGMCKEHKELERNKKEAYKRLAECDKLKIWARELLGIEPRDYTLPTNEVRVYNEPDNRVKDQRTGNKYSYRDVMEGDALSKIMEDLLRETLKENEK